MFEDIFTETVTLRVPTGSFADGQTEYAEFQGVALIADFTRRDISRYGNIKNGKIFLLKCAGTPEPGSQIIHQENIYDLQDIKICRNLDGDIECYRCVVV